MQHLAVLFNILCLMAGCLTLARLAARLKGHPGTRAKANLAFFTSYSALIVAAAGFSYYLANIDAGPTVQLAFSASIFAGMAALEWSMVWLLHAQAGRLVGGRVKALVAVCILMTLAAIPLMFSLEPLGLSFIALALAFVPFGAVVGGGLLGTRAWFKSLPRGRGVHSPHYFWLYLPVGALAACELWQGAGTGSVAHGGGEPFVALSLPLAYMLTTIQFIKAPDDPPSGPAQAGGEASSPAASLALSPEQIQALDLTPRESQIAQAILAGQSNKEIAFALGLSENTVRNHIYNLYQKLGIQKRMDLVQLAQGQKTLPGR